MCKDPIVDEVRSVRKEIERQYPDARSFYEHLEQQQKAYADRLTRRQPKPMPRAHAS
ncbi:MAG TPA: hypothetical protein PKH24_21790 [Sedimentisphaerales bacterium]|jgi:hypothetical protein|nr:hypothetical protein [Sedimentisphaerales bacterium]HNU31922.1 hypothetical protein [Sedimentisphaerales bacterium]